MDPTCFLTGLSLWASAEKAEAVSPLEGHLHLNREPGGWKPFGATKQKDSQGRSQALGALWANLSLVALWKHIMKATPVSLLEGCTWPGPPLSCPREHKAIAAMTIANVHEADPNVKHWPRHFNLIRASCEQQCLSPILQLTKPGLREAPSLGQPAQPGSHTAEIQTQAGWLQSSPSQLLCSLGDAMMNWTLNLPLRSCFLGEGLCEKKKI